MEIPNKNQQATLPYDNLAMLGIDRENADRLPQDVKRKLMAGEVTLLLQVSLKVGNGTVLTLPLKLQLAADKDGNPTLIAYPVQRELSIENIHNEVYEKRHKRLEERIAQLMPAEQPEAEPDTSDIPEATEPEEAVADTAVEIEADVPNEAAEAPEAIQSDPAGDLPQGTDNDTEETAA